jgi:copper chaperone
MTRVAIDIQGMSCGGCVVAVRAVLGRQAGVTNVDVAVGRASFDLDSAQIDLSRVCEAIARAGFEAAPSAPA